jgi:hypothetical protein
MTLQPVEIKLLSALSPTARTTTVWIAGLVFDGRDDSQTHSRLGTILVGHANVGDPGFGVWQHRESQWRTRAPRHTHQQAGNFVRLAGRKDPDSVSKGILNEVYHPTIDRPQSHDLQYLISYGETLSATSTI